MKSFNQFINESFKQITNATKLDDIEEMGLAQDYRRLVKSLKSKPGHEIVLKKTIEDPDYTKRTGLGDSANLAIQPISGGGLGSEKRETRGKREFITKILAINEDVMPGGLADKETVESLAKKHGVSVDQIKSQVEKGTKVEMEHTDDPDVARETAMDHVFEDPKYYDKLAKMEKE